MLVRNLIVATICLCILGNLSLRNLSAQEETSVQFNRDIRPILSDKCYACHGPDEKQRKADLRLDIESMAKEDLGGYAAIVEGNIDDSELLARIFSNDSNEVMPPANHRKSLTDREKQLLKQWIEDGANWQQHWAWISPTRSNLPETVDVNWPRNYIDQFILAKLESLHVSPSIEADRITLMRRIYFDLLGLPPSPEQVDAFLNDKSDDAYEKLVDRLLASPHFGERLAIYWLDLVRYADTVGYHGDQDISVSPYRDYVIEAFNNNMPFDQMTREQLAGDLLVAPTDQQLIASGYNRLGMMSAEGGVQPEEYLTKYAADRVRTTASVWLGITLGCAECHDHKFDPLTINDFYSFASFFADIKERGLYSGANDTGDWGPSIDVPDEVLPNLLLPIDEKLSSLKQSITAPPEVLAEDQREWEKEILERSAEWTYLAPLIVESYQKTELEILDDHSILMKGDRADEDCYAIVAELPEGTYHGLRLEALPHESLPQQGPGRAGNGNFVVTQILAVRGDFSNRMEDLKKVFQLWQGDALKNNLQLSNASATIEQAAAGDHPYKSWSAASAIDHDAHGSTFGWAILPEAGKANELVVNFSQPLNAAKNEKLTIVLQQYHGAGGHVLGHFRLSTTTREHAVSNPMKSLPVPVQEILRIEKPNRTDQQNKQLAEYFISIAPRFQSIRNEIGQLEKERETIVKQHTRTSLITTAVEPREMRVLPRGNWMDNSGMVVTPQFPDFLKFETTAQTQQVERLTRLDLAHWISDPGNPLTARAFINRLWMLYFGTGLSKVLDDLGSQGEWPSHPKLLDTMAVEFIESGWNIKAMIRSIVTSQTYRQSSARRPDLATIDPYNRLLARQTRFRLDAEILRDNALAVSDLLENEIGGRSAKPYQPAGLYRHLNFPKREYRADNDQNQFRRGLYTHWQRQFLHPAMKAFDAPAREECTCQRPRSNTPTGALVLLNDPTFVEAARKLSENIMRCEFETQPRLKQMFRQALSRNPNEREVDILMQLYRNHLEHYQVNETQAKELVSTGISSFPEDLPVDQLAAWTSVARTIMNMHEFVTRN